ncbi:uncharacterized protein LOC111701624 [Eurytemora carolleeae]|uniref:uncharacterized protein LOC111701624 n=1 Tax=Eurytemora carolleeae TaxID=1294199 RepID=UPI000C7705F0|nr:uncharacterized protein LOC111701624 [Eurytemora carolleeae]|eukprot:XP_023328761.1 uncharacterized protein LOC111701624 [Eurytemora affinis]
MAALTLLIVFCNILIISSNIVTNNTRLNSPTSTSAVDGWDKLKDNETAESYRCSDDHQCYRYLQFCDLGECRHSYTWVILPGCLLFLILCIAALLYFTSCCLHGCCCCCLP